MTDDSFLNLRRKEYYQRKVIFEGRIIRIRGHEITFRSNSLTKYLRYF